LNTEENYKALRDSSDCNFYFREVADQLGDSILIDHRINFKKLQLNTKSRVRAYLTYDRQLSGGVYRLTPYSQTKNKCSNEVLNLLGGE